MSRARRSAPAVLHLLGGLTLLLLCPPAVRGDCGLPPDIPNAQPPLGGLTRFPEDATITYKCNEGFVKVPGKPDSVVCIKDKWSEVAEFCNRSCDVPTRLVFASLKQPYSKQSYFPAGSTVEYECRLGYEKDQSLSGKLTCLQDFTWSKPAEFCKKKACPDPGKIKNGHVNIPSGILFGSAIFFSCNTGYELVGVTSSYCLLMGKDVGWRDPLPECKESLPATKAPPAVQKPTAVNVQATEPAPIAQKPTSATVPATEPPPASQKPTSANASATEVPATAQKPPVSNALPRETSPAAQNPNTAKDSAAQATPTAQRASTTKASFTQSLPTTQKSTAIHAPVAKGLQTTQTSVRITAIRGLAVPRATTRFHATSTSKGRGTPPSSGAMILTSGLVAGTIIIGTLIVVKIIWHYGKSGTHIYNIDSFDYDASNHWLADLAKEELRRAHKCRE
ncbi:complement decay-accelerating factor isoform X1 [Elephas maximus indicus]|uniref:complement decay-accelerating factor isoform X1 n=1 Tax=Elephas maximus indicus TaxID=99487 RepID=UPI00211682A0|nr:complement decay-accelerating factor isoform X1 [Elephas maximus indicus]